MIYAIAEAARWVDDALIATHRRMRCSKRPALKVSERVDAIAEVMGTPKVYRAKIGSYKSSLLMQRPVYYKL